MQPRSYLAAFAFLLGLVACGGSGGGSEAPTLVSITISGVPAAALTPGQSAQLIATANYSDGTARDVTATAAWNTSDAAVLTVSAGGTVTAVAPGQADVSATVQESSARAALQVVPPMPRLASFAGNMGGPGNLDGSALDARFFMPMGIAVDREGNLFVADTFNYAIRKITPEGSVSTYAGSSGMPGSADGTGSSARFTYPAGIATDRAGNVYVADTNSYTVRKIAVDRAVTTLAGLAGARGSSDGLGAAARFSEPRGVATDGAGNVYVTDGTTIRKIAVTGAVTTLAGAPESPGSANGPGAEARFRRPAGIAADSVGNLYVADTFDYTIRRIAPDGTVTAFAGLSLSYGSADGVGAEARFYYPEGLAVDTTANVYVGSLDGTVRRISPAAAVITLAGAAGSSGSADGAGPNARFAGSSLGVATDSAGTVYVADSGNDAIRKVTPVGMVSTVVGRPESGGYADGPLATAMFGRTGSVANDGLGNVYVGDAGNGVVRKITSAGTVSTVAGVDGGDLAADGAGSVYVATGGSTSYPEHIKIRKVAPTGAVSYVADVSGFSASKFRPSAGRIAADSSGNVYLSDFWGHTISRISPSGEITLLAGAPGIEGTADGVGSEARFSYPGALAIDRSGNLYVAESRTYYPGGAAVRKITPAGVVSTLAGGAAAPSDPAGDGAGTTLGRLTALATDNEGNVYAAEARMLSAPSYIAAGMIRKITPAGAVTTIAGAPDQVGFMPGALPGVLSEPYGIAVSGRTLYVSLYSGVAVITDLP